MALGECEVRDAGLVLSPSSTLAAFKAQRTKTQHRARLLIPQSFLNVIFVFLVHISA